MQNSNYKLKLLIFLNIGVWKRFLEKIFSLFEIF